jgi:hypothetical protein
VYALLGLIGEALLVSADTAALPLPSPSIRNYGNVYWESFRQYYAHSIRPEPLGYELEAEWLMAEGSTQSRGNKFVAEFMNRWT